jgi:hypothetical protein
MNIRAIIHNLVEARLIELDEKFTQEAGPPDEPRDWHGRWTTGTTTLKSWFGNSKVVDENGKPLIVYHGTLASDFDEFKLRRDDIGFHFGGIEAASDRLSYLTREGTRKSGGRIIPVYLKIDNPLRMDESGAGDLLNLKFKLKKIFHSESSRISNLKSYDQIREFIQSKGYDGIVYADPGEEGIPSGKDSYIVFKATQIKSAIGNKGTFDPKSPRLIDSLDEKFWDPELHPRVPEGTSKGGEFTFKRIGTTGPSDFTKLSGDLLKPAGPVLGSPEPKPDPTVATSVSGRTVLLDPKTLDVKGDRRVGRRNCTCGLSQNGA